MATVPDLTAIDHVVLTSADPDRLVAFWRDVIGARVTPLEDGRVELHVGNQKLNVVDVRGFDGAPPSYCTPGTGNVCLLTTSDPEDVAAHLVAHGVTIVEGPVEKIGATGPILSVYLRDPDGNLVEIARPLGAEHLGEARRPFWLDQGPPPADAQRLWAPWRFGYVAGGDPIEGCPFCVLPARGPERDRESLVLHRGAHAYVIMNAYPYNPGHVMVIPYVHEADLEALPDETADEVWSLARRTVAVLKERLGCQGVNLGMNLGEAAGAGIAPHQHLHAVPRWGGDTNFISVIGAARVLPRALDEVYAELRPGFTT